MCEKLAQVWWFARLLSQCCMQGCSAYSGRSQFLRLPLRIYFVPACAPHSAARPACHLALQDWGVTHLCFESDTEPYAKQRWVQMQVANMRAFAGSPLTTIFCQLGWCQLASGRQPEMPGRLPTAFAACSDLQ